MIEIRCPRCSHSLKTSDRHAGKRGKCPKCNHVFLIAEGTIVSQAKTESPVVSTKPSSRKPTRAIPFVIAAIVLGVFGVFLTIAYFQEPSWLGGAMAFGALFATWHCLKDAIHTSGIDVRARPEYQEAKKLLGLPTEETVDRGKSCSFQIKEIVTFKRIPAILTISPSDLRISGGIADDELVVPHDERRKVRLGLRGHLVVQVAGLSKLITLRARRTAREFRLQQDSINVVAAWLNQSRLQVGSESSASLEESTADDFQDKRSGDSHVLRQNSHTLKQTHNRSSEKPAALPTKRSSWSRRTWEVGIVVFLLGIVAYGTGQAVWGRYWRAQKLVSDKPFTDDTGTFRAMTPFPLRKNPSTNELFSQLPGSFSGTIRFYESSEQSIDLTFGVSVIQLGEADPRANKRGNSGAQIRSIAERDAIATAAIDGTFNRLPAVQERSRETIVRGEHRVSRATALFWPNKEIGQTGVAVEVYVLPDRVYQLLAMVSWTTDAVPCVEQFFESFAILEQETDARHLPP